MKPETLRKLDRWLGRPLCWGLTQLRRLGDLIWTTKAISQRPRSILFIKLVEQGASVLAYRALARAVEAVGRDNVYLLVFAENRAILDIMDVIPRENILAVRADGLVTMTLDLCRTMWRIRQAGIEATVDLEFFARGSAILAFLSGARYRVGLHNFDCDTAYRGDLMTHRIQHNPYLHVAAAYHVLVEALLASNSGGPDLNLVADDEYEAPTFVPPADELARMRSLVDQLCGGQPAGPLVLLNPNAGDLLPLRRWATDRFIELGRRILAEFPGAFLGITGAPTERDAAEDLARAIDPARTACFAGKTTLRDLLVLYQLSDALVTNDSGPGHFASMAKLDTVVLFGPETPAVFGPLGGHAHVLWSKLACSPCVNAYNHRSSACTNNRCMQSISVDRVLQEVRLILMSKGFTRSPSATEPIGLPVLP